MTGFDGFPVIAPVAAVAKWLGAGGPDRMDRARTLANARSRRQNPAPLRREPRRRPVLLVALAVISLLLAHDALMAAAPPSHAPFPIVASGADLQHPAPDEPPHPAACGTVQVAAAPRAGDLLAPLAHLLYPALPIPAGGESVGGPAVPGPLGRAMPRARLQVWRV